MLLDQNDIQEESMKATDLEQLREYAAKLKPLQSATPFVDGALAQEVVLRVEFLLSIAYQELIDTIEAAMNDRGVLSEYIAAAMRTAKYEPLVGGEGICGNIPALQGCWFNAPTQDECRVGLASALESWLVFKLRHRLLLPEIDGVSLVFTKQAEGVCG